MLNVKQKQSLATEWSASVNKNKAWDVYPRPQLVRAEWINLNGYWDYCITRHTDSSPLSSFKPDGQIVVPFPLESSLSTVQRALKPGETLWYKTLFQLEQLSDIVCLHFGAVDWKTKVWVNGVQIGEHKGGYCPFTMQIQHAIQEGENELIVAVQDDTDHGLQERGKQSLTPKGLFYTAVSGIWQTVWLEQLKASSINTLSFTSHLDTSTVAIKGQLYQTTTAMLQIKLFDKEHCIMQEQLQVDGEHFQLSLHIPDAKLWHPDHPHLYDIELAIIDQNGQQLDKVSSYFAMREVAMKKTSEGAGLTLNGQPIYQLGILDQGYWPDGLYTAPTDEALIDDILQMKQLGFNMLRKHIKVEQARFYYHCDRLGMLVWQDMVNGGATWNVVQEAILPNVFPNWFRRDDTQSSYKRTGRVSKENRNQFIAELTEMIESLRHFPSIVVWCPFNEGWGQFNAKAITELVLKLDSTRLIDHASGWFDQGAGHMRSVHTYFRPLTKPRRTYGRIPVLSEFGGYNFKLEQHTELGHKEVGYKTCSSQEQLQQAYLKLMDQLAKQIDEGLCASVYTQLSDVEGEVNGVITYDRKVVKLNKQQTLKKHQELIERFNRKWNENR